MELIRIKANSDLKKSDRILLNNSTNFAIKSLQHDNILIKRKLKEIESKLYKLCESINFKLIFLLLVNVLI